jgi:hypothetical protein
MEKINNLDDLRYRKLFLRSEIKLLEQKIGNKSKDLNKELQSANIKNEVLQSMIKNPVVVMNIARLAFDLFSRVRKNKRKRSKQKGKKA